MKEDETTEDNMHNVTAITVRSHSQYPNPTSTYVLTKSNTLTKR